MSCQHDIRHWTFKNKCCTGTTVDIGHSKYKFHLTLDIQKMNVVTLDPKN